MTSAPKKINPKKKWFPAPDSLCQRTDGSKQRYYNIEGRFEDHKVINIPKSEEAREQVYDTSIVLHTRIILTGFGTRAVDNMTSQAIRFDKGVLLRQPDFQQAKAGLYRFWEAWQHYQTFRTAPVTDLETEALLQISKMKTPARSLTLEALNIPVFEEEGEYEDDEPEEAPASVVHVAQKPKGGKKAKQSLAA